MAEKRNPHFIIDANAGKLAGWLRMMGYDALFFRCGSDSEMVKTAADEERIIITRDTRLMQRRVVKSGEVEAVLLSSDDPVKQMAQLISSLDIKPGYRPFSICISCNQPLVEVPREAVREQLPEYVYKTQGAFHRCQACGRVYWRGTHWKAMKKLLEEWEELKDQ